MAKSKIKRRLQGDRMKRSYRIAVPLEKLILSRLGSIGRQRPDIGPARPNRVARLIKASRLPILGLRSQINKKVKYGQKVSGSVAGYFKDQELALTDRRICRSRTERRRTLFASGIAGKNRKRSPGVAGHYRRNSDSEITCRR